jgi:hypothetical protein
MVTAPSLLIINDGYREGQQDWTMLRMIGKGNHWEHEEGLLNNPKII